MKDDKQWSNLEQQESIIQQTTSSWNKYIEALRSEQESFTRYEVKSLMGIVYDSAQKETENLLDHLKIKQEKIDALCVDLEEKDKEIAELNNMLSKASITIQDLTLKLAEELQNKTNHL